VAKTKIRRSEKTAILARVQTIESLAASWQISDRSLALSSLALTAVSSTLPVGISQYNLVLSANALSAGSTYKFTLTAGISSASIDVMVTAPPRPGLFTITPTNGTALETTFTFTASKWLTDTDDLPMTYVFLYDASGVANPSGEGYTQVQSRSEVKSASSLLPAGPVSSGHRVACRTAVFNVLNARAYLEVMVLVEKVEFTAEEMSRFISSKLGEIEGDEKTVLDTTRQIVAASTSSMNAVNCSLAPNCTALNREECSATAHTCGECIDGYLGDSGDSNAMCFDASRLRSSGQQSKNITCATNADCTVPFQQCAAGGACMYPSRECPLDCSGHGYCLFEKSASGEAVATCRVNDVSCKAVCDCDGGFFGDGCQSSQSEIESKRQSRLDMFVAINNTIKYAEVTEENTEDLVSLLAQLTATPQELSVESCGYVESLVQYVLRSAVELTLSYEGTIACLYIVLSILSIITRIF
jgi:hypothetical protein